MTLLIKIHRRYLFFASNVFLDCFNAFDKIAWHLLFDIIFIRLPLLQKLLPIDLRPEWSLLKVVAIVYSVIRFASHANFSCSFESTFCIFKAFISAVASSIHFIVYIFSYSYNLLEHLLSNVPKTNSQFLDEKATTRSILFVCMSIVSFIIFGDNCIHLVVYCFRVVGWSQSSSIFMPIGFVPLRCCPHERNIIFVSKIIQLIHRLFLLLFEHSQFCL